MSEPHVHCWHGQGHPDQSDPSCCLCDSSGCPRTTPTEETPMTVTDDKSEGLLPKYRVERSSDPTGKHTDCRYFVLDPQHDPLAWRALAYYAALARTGGYEALAADLQGWLDDLYDPDFVYGADQNPSFDPPPTAYPAGLRHKAEHERSHGTRCVVCATTDHTSESHLRRMPYDEARAVLRDMTPCAAHFACINKITCQRPGADRD